MLRNFEELKGISFLERELNDMKGDKGIASHHLVNSCLIFFKQEKPPAGNC